MKNLIISIAILTPFWLHAQPTEEQIRQVEEAKKEVKGMKGQPFPDFELTSLDGTVYTKDELKGKILLVNFWFSRCTPCIQEMPEMNEMVEEFKNEEIVFLAPTFDKKDQVDKFLTRRDFKYDIVPDVKDFCLEMNVRSYPTHFVVNREGTIEKVIIGYSVMTVKGLRKIYSEIVEMTLSQSL